MNATDLRKGIAVETARGRKVVQSSTPTNGTLQRVAFVDGDICLCPPDTEFTTATQRNTTGADTMTTATDTPRIYVACLASYNAGILHGEWIDATDVDEIREAIDNMLAKSRQPIAEEWAIHDYENFGGLRLSEWEDLDKVAELGALIEEHGEAFAAYADNVGTDHATEEGFQEAYCGEYDSERAYAEELFDELYLHDVPEHVQNYIDYDAFARDVFMGDNYSVTGDSGSLYVFRNC